MKCNHCKSEWSANPSFSSNLTSCPFCGQSLLHEKETLNTIEDVLIEINRLFGISVLTDKSKIVAYFYDLAPQLSRQRRILKYFVECNGPQKLANVMHASKDEQSACVKRIVKEMTEELFIEESASQTVCDAFLHAITDSQVVEDIVSQPIDGLQPNIAILNRENQTDSLTVEEQYQKGEAYYFGTDTVQQNYKNAFTWYQRAALQGHSFAQCQLGLMYREGRGTTKDEKKAFDWFMKAAENQQSCPRGKFYVARSYHFGNGVPVDYKKAVKWYLTAANEGDAYAQLNLGTCFEKGEGVRKDLQIAFYWYERAAKQEEPLAQCNLGCMYLEGKGVRRDVAKAVALFKKAADHQEPFGIYMLGKCYLIGVGVEKDIQKAFDLIKRAAEKDDNDAQYNLADGYEKGIWGTQDLKKAFFWYEKAAKSGHTTSQVHVAKYYLTGCVVKKDLDTAIQWYQKAANGGSVFAMVTLSDFYECGNGLPKDEAQTFYWLQKAIKKDYVDAIFSFLSILGKKQNLTEENCKWLAQCIGKIDMIVDLPSIESVLMKYGYKISCDMVAYHSTKSAGVKIMRLLADKGCKEAQAWLAN